jgi:hypothetical protein
VRHACVTADAEDGDHPNFLAGLEAHRARSVVALRADFPVVLTRPGTPARRVKAVLDEVPAAAWRTSRWGEGSPGWRRGWFVAWRCWPVISAGRGPLGWRIGGREPGGQPKPGRDSGSKFGAWAAWAVRVEDAPRRPRVEPEHAAAQGPWGGEQSQGGLGLGFHRPAVRVRLGYSFLVWPEWQPRPGQRRGGRTRRPVSPSTGPAACVAPGGASPGERLAAP